MSNGVERLTSLSNEEISILRKEGNEVVYIAGKNYFLFYFYIVITLGFTGVGKSSLINT